MEEEIIKEKEIKTILVVDDEPAIRDLLKYNLEREGYRIIEASDGIEGINVALEQKPDIILLDIMLPKLDGLSVCKRIKNSMSIPIIMLTAKSEEIDTILGLELGADDYITKPFSVRELAARVKANLRKYEVVSVTDAKPVDASNEEKKKESKIVVGDLELDLDKFEVNF